jgi:hypothetical protein
LPVERTARSRPGAAPAAQIEQQPLRGQSICQVQGGGLPPHAQGLDRLASLAWRLAGVSPPFRAFGLCKAGDPPPRPSAPICALHPPDFASGQKSMDAIAFGSIKKKGIST